MLDYGKRVTVLGLGKSGYESALYLAQKNFEVSVSEQGSSPLLEQRASSLLARGIGVELGSHSLDQILSSDWIVISPGIPPASTVYRAIARKKIPVVSEIEVASWFCPTDRVIAITGTCGKTTVTTLTGEVLRSAGVNAVQCGNIGNPWIGELTRLKQDDVVVLELSSFQLFHCREFKPWIGVLLNVGENHQDWHSSIAEYADAKAMIFKNQHESDWAILRSEDEANFLQSVNIRSRKIYLGNSSERNPNFEVVRQIAEIAGIADSNCDQAIQNFQGIEHRMELCGNVDGVYYVNDSKSTTTASLCWALQGFSGKEVVLIAGGHPKSQDFYLVNDLLETKVKTAVLVGEARELLAGMWKDHCPCVSSDNFEDAVSQARSVASSGDTVLLSPACASFDMFANYEERGRIFKKLVRAVSCR